MDTVYETEPDVRVLVREHHPVQKPKGEIILVHGLEGSCDSGYMRSFAHYGATAGWCVHRTNIRTCGPTENWCKTLYHAGLTTDIKFLVRSLAKQGRGPIFIIGYSLGGNQVLNAAAELSVESPGMLAGVCAVSTPIQLALCAKKIEEPANYVYMSRFLTSMKKRLRRRAAAMPGLFTLDGLDDVRTIYEIDDIVTAPNFGFGTADNYYRTQSSAQFLDRITVPVLLLAAEDDPIVPISCFHHAGVKSANIQFVQLPHGGHVSFLARGEQRFWLDHFLLDWASKH